MTTQATTPPPAEVAAPAGEKRVSQARRREARTGWMFVSPFFLLFTLCFLIPIGFSLYYSFFRQQATGGGLFGNEGGASISNVFVGFQNYEYVLTSDAFWTGIGRVLLFGIIQVPLMIGMALALALLLDSITVRRPGPWRLSYFLPYAIPGVVAAVIWTYIYQPSTSPINKILEGAGAGGVNFFDPNIIILSMANMTTWTYTGYNMLIFLAALQAIPRELYDAARIDGATGFGIIRKIKIPLVRDAALLAILLSIIGTVQLFNEPTVLESVNDWMGLDYMPMMMAYNSLMGGITPSGNGPASAISIVMALIAGLLAIGYAILQRRTAP
ncbi:MAG: sugar ABC transporter permease [bacterium]|nr:sugar ABC transporter permease [bacterium]